MGDKMKHRVILSLIILATAFIGTSVLGHGADKQCINIYVDFGSLNNNNKISKCVEEIDGMTAIQALQKTDLVLVGTEKYGDAVVCRVNGLPDAKREKCQSMPPENAYWAVIIKRQKTIADPFPKWGWAQTGINDVYLNTGDSLGLVFTENGKVKWPN